MMVHNSLSPPFLFPLIFHILHAETSGVNGGKVKGASRNTRALFQHKVEISVLIHLPNRIML